MTTKNPHAVALGRRGGSVSSAAKTAAARKNAQKGGRPKGSRNRRDDRIAEMYKDVDGWWIYLKRGWIVQDEGTHGIVEDRKRDALDKMSLVVPCECAECKAGA